MHVIAQGVARVEIADEVPEESGLGVPIGIITLDGAPSSRTFTSLSTVNTAVPTRMRMGVVYSADIMRQLLPPPTSLSSLPVHLHKGMRQFVPRVGCVEDLKRPLLSRGRQF